MSDEIVTQAASEPATTDTASSAAAPITSEEVTTVGTGDTSTPVTTPEPDTFETKLDVKSLQGEQLRIYKKLQADYTRARQADKVKFEALQQQVSSFQPLLNDPDIKAKAHYLQYGRYPEGYTPTPVGVPQQPQTQEEQVNIDEINDPVVRKLYLDNQKLLQESQSRAQEKQAQMVENTNKGVKAFVDALTPTHKKLWQENLKEISENAVVYAKEGVPVDKALKRAFNAACADKLYEQGKLDAMTSMKQKVATVRPESGVNVADGIVKGEYKTPQDAVRAAIDSLNR